MKRLVIIFALLFPAMYSYSQEPVFYIADAYDARVKYDHTETPLRSGKKLFLSDSVFISKDGFAGLIHLKTYSTIDLTEGKYLVSQLVEKCRLNELPVKKDIPGFPKILPFRETTSMSGIAHCTAARERCRCLGNGFRINAGPENYYLFYKDSIAFNLTIPPTYTKDYTLLQMNLFDETLKEQTFSYKNPFISLTPTDLPKGESYIIFRIKNYEEESTDGLLLKKISDSTSAKISRYLQNLTVGVHIGKRTYYLLKAINYEDHQCYFNALYYYRRYAELSDYHPEAMDVYKNFLERHCMLDIYYYEERTK